MKNWWLLRNNQKLSNLSKKELFMIMFNRMKSLRKRKKKRLKKEFNSLKETRATETFMSLMSNWKLKAKRVNRVPQRRLR
jgi:hypothetical protein